MGKVLDLAPTKAQAQADKQDVVAAAEELLARAKRGELRGLMYFAQEGDGSYSCGKSGVYRRTPTLGLMPALASLLKLCGMDGRQAL